MQTKTILNDLAKAHTQGDKRFAVLIDPDQSNLQHFEQILKLANGEGVDYILLGGSLILDDKLNHCIHAIKGLTDIPIMLFPGSVMQVSPYADAILFLSLISGRNPEYLIGQHVQAAPMIHKSKLEVIPTGYMLVDGGRLTSAQYISHSLPLPSDKEEIAVATALAGQMLGMQCLYMDAGSGAKQPVPNAMIQSVRDLVNLPLIIGGGLDNAEKVYQKAKAGATMVVVGNAIEKDPALILEMSQALKDARVAI